MTEHAGCWIIYKGKRGSKAVDILVFSIMAGRDAAENPGDDRLDVFFGGKDIGSWKLEEPDNWFMESCSAGKDEEGQICMSNEC